MYYPSLVTSARLCRASSAVGSGGGKHLVTDARTSLWRGVMYAPCPIPCTDYRNRNRYHSRVPRVLAWPRVVWMCVVHSDVESSLRYYNKGPTTNNNSQILQLQ